MRALQHRRRGASRRWSARGLFECGRRNGDFRQAPACSIASASPGGGTDWSSPTATTACCACSTCTHDRSANLAGDDCHWSNGVQLAGGEPAGVAADGAAPAAGRRHQPPPPDRGDRRRLDQRADVWASVIAANTRSRLIQRRHAIALHERGRLPVRLHGRDSRKYARKELRTMAPNAARPTRRRRATSPICAIPTPT